MRVMPQEAAGEVHVVPPIAADGIENNKENQCALLSRGTSVIEVRFFRIATVSE